MASITPYPGAKHQPCWRLSYRDPKNGKWRNKLLHCDKIQAEKIRKQHEAEFTWYRENPHLLEQRHEVPLPDLVKIFISSKSGTVQASTIRRYQFALNNLEAFAGDIQVGEITRALIDGFRAGELEEREPAGVNADLRHIKAFLRYAHDEGYLPRVPKIDMAREVRQPLYYLTRKQYEDQFEDAGEVLGEDASLIRDISDVLLLTAARVNELLTATWEQINLEAGHIQLIDDKGNTAGKLYLSNRAVEILRKYEGQGPRPFMISYFAFDRRLDKLTTETGVRMMAHDLRRTAGAWMVQDGVDIFHVSRFMRHSSVTVTESHYADLLPQNHQNTAERMAHLLEKPAAD